MTILMQLLSTFIYITSFSLVQASLYVNQPVSSSTCYGGQPCTVSWLDDGESPLLNEIGTCYVGLYHGNGTLVQAIDPVNVNIVHSLTFTPDPIAGPDSNSYYVNFTSVSLLVNRTSHYTQYSADFTLASMSGSFASPVASDTSTLPVPSSVLSPTSTNGSPSTVTDSPSSSVAVSVSAASVSTPSSGSSVSTSGLKTSRIPSSSASIVSSGTNPSSTVPSSSSKSAAQHNVEMLMGAHTLLLLFGSLAPCLFLV